MELLDQLGNYQWLKEDCTMAQCVRDEYRDTYSEATGSLQTVITHFLAVRMLMMMNFKSRSAGLNTQPSNYEVCIIPTGLLISRML
jgi:hypothetical protein